MGFTAVVGTATILALGLAAPANAQAVPSSERVAFEALVAELDAERPPAVTPRQRPAHRVMPHAARWLLSAGVGVLGGAAAMLPFANEGCGYVEPEKNERFVRSTRTTVGVGSALLLGGVLRLAIGGVARTERRQSGWARFGRVLLHSIMTATTGAATWGLLLGSNASAAFCNS